MGNTNSIPEAQRTMQRQLQYCQERRTQLQWHISSLEALAWREKDEIERNMVSVARLSNELNASDPEGAARAGKHSPETSAGIRESAESGKHIYRILSEVIIINRRCITSYFKMLSYS
ncbi:hypothetical protein BHE74_00002593 [Ensete ventricosum]|nr:hypothetical protein BHE74_00002593 [Ensete ventricosum]